MAGYLPVCGADLFQCGAVGAQPVPDDDLWRTMRAHCFFLEFQRGLLISGVCDKAFQNLTLVIDGPTQLVPLAVDLHEHLTQVPQPPTAPHALNTALSDLGSEQRTKPVPSKSYRLMADFDAALVHKVFHISE
jgi:hypothetical protein